MGKLFAHQWCNTTVLRPLHFYPTGQSAQAPWNEEFVPQSLSHGWGNRRFPSILGLWWSYFCIHIHQSVTSLVAKYKWHFKQWAKQGEPQTSGLHLHLPLLEMPLEDKIPYHPASATPGTGHYIDNFEIALQGPLHTFSFVTRFNISG